MGRPVAAVPAAVTGDRPRRLWWGVVDQAVAGLAGAAVTLQGVAALQPAEFGRLAAVLAGYYLVLTGLRAVVSEVYVLRFAGWLGRPPVGAARWAQIATLRLALLIAAPTGLVAAAGSALPVASRQLLGAVAVALPVLLWQEVRRAMLLAAVRPARAVAGGVLVLAGQVTGGIALWLADRVSGPALLLCWAVGAAVAIGCVPVADRRRMPGRAGAWRWLVEGRAYWPRFLCQGFVRVGAVHAVLLLVAVAAGTLVVAGVRTALLLLTPLVLAQQAAVYFALGEATRARSDRLWRFVVVCQVGAIVAGVAWLAALTLLPRPALAPLVGANLAGGLAALPGMALFMVGSLLLAAPVAALHGSGQVPAGTALAITLVPVLLAVPTLIVLRGGSAAEVAATFGAFGVLSALTWTAVSATLLRTRRPDGLPDGPADLPPDWPPGRPAQPTLVRSGE